MKATNCRANGASAGSWNYSAAYVQSVGLYAQMRVLMGEIMTLALHHCRLINSAAEMRKSSAATSSSRTITIAIMAT